MVYGSVVGFRVIGGLLKVLVLVRRLRESWYDRRYVLGKSGDVRLGLDLSINCRVIYTVLLWYDNLRWQEEVVVFVYGSLGKPKTAPSSNAKM